MISNFDNFTENDAMHLVSGRCCGKNNSNCLLIKLNNSYPAATTIVLKIRKEMLYMNAEEKRNHLRSKVQASFKGLVNKYGSYEWTVEQVKNVCSIMFIKCYDITKSCLEELCKEVKGGIISNSREFSDRTSVGKDTARQTPAFAEQFNITLNNTQKAAIVLPNTVPAKTLYSWLKWYFHLCGDFMPNENEIHLDPCDKSAVHKEYIQYMISENQIESILQYSVFIEIWNDCFPHVKIREYKAVTGKCETCAKLSTLRGSFKDTVRRRICTQLHALHRGTIMAERAAYYDRIRLAIENPKIYLSMISDGMAQIHCELPYFGNMHQYSKTIPQHLQGILCHGRSMYIYRTFGNFKGGADQALYFWLLNLEEVYTENNNSLPKTVYYQIDGGSENANKATYGMCELLVSKRLVNKIVISRLPVGHTHEDIDATFALIWEAAKNHNIITPEYYERIILKALRNKTWKQKVIDIFAIPDFHDLIDDCIDPHFGRFKTMEWTQLVFQFEAVPHSEHFPTGVKVTYRAYSQDIANELIPAPPESHPCGLYVRSCRSINHPAATDTSPEGMYLLHKLPNKQIKPKEFIQGSRSDVESVATKIKTNYRNYQDVVNYWDNWLQNYFPLSDDVNEYVLQKPLHIPFADILFEAENVRRDIISDLMEEMVEITDVIAAPSVQWSNRGVPLENVPPRLNIDGTNVVTITNDNEQSKSRKRVRATLEGVLQTSQVIFVPMSSWPDYADYWPYPFPLVTSYVRAIAGDFNESRKKINIFIETFDLTFTADLKWARKYGIFNELPPESHLLTIEEYTTHEINKRL